MSFAASLAPPQSLSLRAEPILSRITLIMALSLCITLPAYALDTRLFQGENVWLKPIKFQLALALYFGTLALYATWLPESLTTSPKIRRLLIAAGLASFAEMIWIGWAAMFGTASHYNTMPLLYGVYALMGVLAVLLITVSLVFGLAFWRAKRSPLSEPLRLSMALGLVLTFVLTLIAAGTLSALSGHHIGTPITGSSLPLMGWSREVGDLRVAHFLATHALHAIPLIGLLAVAFLPQRLANQAVWAGASAFTALTIFTYIQALSGSPFL